MFKLLSTTILTIAALLLFAAPFSFEVSGGALSIGENVAVAQVATTTSNTANEEPTALQRWDPLYQAQVLGAKVIGAMFLTLGATILWLTGILLNYGIQFSIIDFNSFATISGISIAWTVLRDVANVFFIFIFLTIGISTILGLQQYGAKKLLPLLLIVAVLINFSLFFAKAGVDIAHGFAGAILNQSGVATSNPLSHGVAAAFVEQIGFLDYFGELVEHSDSSINTLGEAQREMFFGIFAFIFMSAIGIVFLGGAVILFMRIVKILLLLITSAPAMAAYILPGTRRFWNSWFEEFLKEVFFAPIFLLLIAISLLFLNTARGAIGIDPDASFAELFVTGDVSTVSLVMFFFITLGFLFMSIKLAQEMKVSGAGAAMGIQKWGQGVAGRTVIGLPAKGIQKAYDAGVAAAPAGVRRTLRAVGFDQAVTDTLSGAQENTFGSKYSVKTLDEAGKKRDTTITTEQRKQGLAAAESKAAAMVQAPGETDEDFQTRQDAPIQEALQKMSDSQIAELGATRLATEEIARNLSPAQLKKALDSDKLDDKGKTSIREARFAPLNKALEMPNTTPAEKTARTEAIGKVAKSYSKQELEVMSGTLMTKNPEIVQTLRSGQFDDIKKSDAFTAAQKAALKKARVEPLVSIAGTASGTPSAIKEAMKNLGTDEIADLDQKVLQNSSVAENLSIPVLNKLQSEKDVLDTTRASISRALERRIHKGDKAAENYVKSPAGMFWQK